MRWATSNPQPRQRATRNPQPANPLLLGRPSGKRFGRRPGRSLYRYLSWLTRQHRVQHESRDPTRRDPGREYQTHCFWQRIKKLKHRLHADPNSQRKRQDQKFAVTELNPLQNPDTRRGHESEQQKGHTVMTPTNIANTCCTATRSAVRTGNRSVSR